MTPDTVTVQHVFDTAEKKASVVRGLIIPTHLRFADVMCANNQRWLDITLTKNTHFLH